MPREVCVPLIDQLSLSWATVSNPIDHEATLNTFNVRRGDIFVINERHRLMCGDSANLTDVQMLVGHDTVHMAHCDPPYNIGVQPRSNVGVIERLKDGDSMAMRMVEEHPNRAVQTKKVAARDHRLVGDFITNEEHATNISRWLANIGSVLMPGGSIYFWGVIQLGPIYFPAFKQAKLHWAQAIIWVKDAPVASRWDFMTDHEICYYGWKLGAPHRFFISRGSRDVWRVKKLHCSQTIHLTEKPIELPLRAIVASSLPGETVLDMFGGSGSTLFAADCANRKALLMEIDPLYCSAILSRAKSLNFTINRLTDAI